jgi:hypothetical protein
MDTTRKLALCRFRPRLCIRKNSCRRRRRRSLPNLDPPFPTAPAAGLLRASRWCSELTRYRRAAFGGTWTVSRLRPFRRRRFSTFCPPGVAMRARKPCVRFRRKLLGWYVRFIRYSFLSRSSDMGRAKGRELRKKRVADTSSTDGDSHHTLRGKSNQQSRARERGNQPPGRAPRSVTKRGRITRMRAGSTVKDATLETAIANATSVPRRM